VLGWERHVQLRHYLEEGYTQREIAKELGIDRRTVYRWIKNGDLDRDLNPKTVTYGPRPPVPHKLDRYKAIIEARLDDYPELTATRLLEEVRAAGYEGGYTQLRLYVRGVRPSVQPEPIIRFETEAGQQGQVDFAHFRFPWGRRYALLVVLGYSRHMWLQFYPKQDMRTLIVGLESAFRFFGGVPRELLFDQMKSVITRDLRGEDGRLIENAEFLRFCAHWGFRPRACRPYRAQTKGKVERPISYVRKGFVYGREFLGDSDLNARALTWLETVANVRVHRTTRERPIDRFMRDELAELLPLATRPYRSFVLPLERTKQRQSRIVTPVPRIEVERRSLQTYSQIAGGAS